jgi:hypothetical protein
MNPTLAIRPDGALDFLALGAVVHRLDPGIVPFRKATECQIHVDQGAVANELFPIHQRFPILIQGLLVGPPTD